jgi:hypothetical protein
MHFTLPRVTNSLIKNLKYKPEGRFLNDGNVLVLNIDSSNISKLKIVPQELADIFMEKFSHGK